MSRAPEQAQQPVRPGPMRSPDFVGETLDGSRAVDAATANENELDWAHRRHDQAAREYGDVDYDWVREWQKTGARIRDIPKDIQAARFRAWRALVHAIYRLKLAEYAAGLRSIEPQHPDDKSSTDSPHYSKP
ncbi:MAG: hypothetical protein GY926_19515 [bacterium]|nr:hypothetical protein [bacterium]